MLLIMWGVLIACGVLFPKSKGLSAAIITFMVVSIGCRTQGADYIAYALEYQLATYQKPGEVRYVGYLMIEKLAHLFGLSFENYVFMAAVLSSLLLYWGLSQMTTNVNLALSLFLIYPYGHELVQMRNFMADVIIVAALPIILKEKSNLIKTKLRQTIILTIVGLAAVSIHFDAVFVVLFLAASIWIPIRVSKKIIPIGTLLLLALVMGNVLPMLLNSFNPRIADWLSSRASIGMIIPIVISLWIWWLERVFTRKAVGISQESGQKILYENCLQVGDYIILMLPFFLYDITFNRVWRVFLIMLYAVASEVLADKAKRRTQSIYQIALIVLVAVIFVYENDLVIVRSAFANNAVFGWLSII